MKNLKKCHKCGSKYKPSYMFTRYEGNTIVYYCPVCIKTLLLRKQ